MQSVPEGYEIFAEMSQPYQRLAFVSALLLLILFSISPFSRLFFSTKARRWRPFFGLSVGVAQLILCAHASWDLYQITQSIERSRLTSGGRYHTDLDHPTFGNWGIFVLPSILALAVCIYRFYQWRKSTKYPATA